MGASPPLPSLGEEMIRTDDMITTPETSILHSIPADELDPLLARLELRRFSPGTVVVSEGDRLRELYVVRSGIAKLYVSTRQGEGYVGRIRVGEAFGEMSVLMDRPAPATLRAASVLEVLVMPRRELEELAERHPVIYRNLGSVLSDRLEQASRGVHQAAGLRL